MKKYILCILLCFAPLSYGSGSITYDTQISDHIGGTISATMIGDNPLDWTISASANPDYKFGYFIDINNIKYFENPVHYEIDTTISNHMIQAVFVRDDAFIFGWSADSLIIKSLSTYLSDNNLGTIDIYVNGVYQSEINNVPDSIDRGIWRLGGRNLLHNNSNTGQSIRLICYNECGEPTSIIDTIVPYLVSGICDIDTVFIPENTNVYVLDNSVLNINADASIDGTTCIYPGGKIVIENDHILTAKSIVMKGNGISGQWAQIGGYGSLISDSNVIYYDYELDYQAYYPLSLPVSVSCSDIYDPLTLEEPLYQSYYYDSETRYHGNRGWTAYDDTQEGAQFDRGKGYIIYSIPAQWNGDYQKTAIMRFPMNFTEIDEESDKYIGVYQGVEDEGRNYDKNWNLIGSPYLSDFEVGTSKLIQGSGEDEYEFEPLESNSILRYISHSSDGFRTYDQEHLSGFTIKPFNCYFVQTIGGSNILFSKDAGIQYTRRRLLKKEQEIGLVISQNNDTSYIGILFGDYDDSYEINADLKKEFGDGTSLSLYSNQINGNTKLSFQAVSSDYMNYPISIGCRGVNSKEPITISLDSYSQLNGIEAVWLTDNKNNIHLNLIEENGIFILDDAVIDDRFYITVIEKNNVATDIIDIQEQKREKIYDIMGRETHSTSPNILYINNKFKEIHIK